VTLPPFELHRARSVDEARDLLLRHGDEAAVLCGGTELLLLLKLGFAAYRHLVDIKGIQSLGGIREEDGQIVIGSTVTHRELERSPVVLDRLPALAAMTRRVANVRVRSVGTLGGNLCFSDPHSDPATLLLALDAEAAYDGMRVPLREFLVGPYETALAPGQLLAAVHVPVPPAGTGVAHRKLAFHERPAATVACAVRLEDGLVAEARIGVGSVGARAVRATRAERALVGAAPGDDDAVEKAAALAADEAEAVDDANGSADYKANLVRVLVTRCFADAAAPSSARAA
jgi:carbon-monoxide dehydrogenase medium subunit